MIDTPPLELRTFGGLRVLHHGAEAAPLPDRSAVLLGALVAARGRVVGRAALVDLIWPEQPPGSAVNQLHRYVGELRRALEPELGTRDSGSLVERHVDGYRLRSDRIDVDLDRFDALVATAAADASVAVDRLLDALELAAAPAFADLTARLSRSPDAVAVEASRISAAESLVTAALASTDPERAVATVVRIAAQNRLNEPLQAGCIRLLTAAGRASEALAHHAAVTEHLRETLGVDPGGALQAAHREALHPDGVPAPSVPTDWISNLPSANPAYVEPPGLGGRLAHLERPGAGSGTVTLLTGGGGIGKTTLAVHLARSIERGSGASSVFIDLRGFDPELPALAAEAAIGAALDQLEVEHAGLTPEAEARLLRGTVRAHPVVAVLDSAVDAEQVRPLLTCLSGSTVIVTTRALLQTLVVREGARLLALDRWDEGAAYDLLAERLGVDPAAPDPALADIARACAGLPLALAIAAARCATVKPDRWPGIAQELSDTVHALDALSAGPADDVRSVFATSLRGLDEDTVTVFRRAALVPAASADLHAFAAVSGLGLDHVRAATRHLVDSSLLGEHGGGFIMHDLVRTYALELLGADERAGAESRAISYLAVVARRAWSLTGRPPVGRPIEPLFDLDVVPVLPDMAGAGAWARPNLEWVAALGRIAAGLGLDREAVATWMDLRPWHSHRMVVSKALAVLAELDERAVAIDDIALRAEVRSSLGFSAGEAGRSEESQRLLESAVELFRSIGDFGGMSKAYKNLANRATRSGEFDEAERLVAKAAELAEASGNGSLVVSAGRMRIELLGEMQQWDRIVELAPAVIRAARVHSPGDLEHLLERHAFALFSIGDSEAALPAAREALAHMGIDEMVVALPLQTIALAAATLGRTEEATAAIERYRELDGRGPLDFAEYFGQFTEDIRAAFRRAAEILAETRVTDG